MIHNLITCLFRQLLGKLGHGRYIGINNALAFGTDEMRMWIRLVPIIAVALLAEIQCNHLTQIFKQIDRLVNGRQAGRGKVRFDPFVDRFYTGVSVALSQDIEYRQSLRSQAKAYSFNL